MKDPGQSLGRSINFWYFIRMVYILAVKTRIRATNNVAKLTNVMKLVASSKLRAVEEALNRGRAFGVSIHVLASIVVIARTGPSNDAQQAPWGLCALPSYLWCTMGA